MEPIVITGCGIVSAIGIGKGETLDALRKGHTGIAPLRYLHTVHRDLPVGEVKLSDDELKQRLGIATEPTTRTALLGMLALDEALDEAGLKAPGTGSVRRSIPGNPLVALVCGTTVGGMDKTEQYYRDYLTNDSRNDYILTHDCGATTTLMARRFPGLFSLCTSVSTACSSAANAVITGANLLRSGQADIAVVGGAECLTKYHLNGFRTLMILDHEPCRPFDATRAGLNLGEGAAFLVLETVECALRRCAALQAQLTGYGNACDAYHQTASSDEGKGAFLAMTKALAAACLQPSDIGYVNAHGTGTPNNDLSESRALQRLFGSTLPPVSSTKGMTGHTTSASGSIEAVISVMALQHQLVPVNYGWRQPMAGGILPAMHSVPPRPIEHVMCNALGFGGNDSSLIFSQPPSIAYES